MFHNTLKVAHPICIYRLLVPVSYLNLVNNLSSDHHFQHFIIVHHTLAGLRFIDQVPDGLLVDGQEIVVLLCKVYHHIGLMVITEYKTGFKSQLEKLMARQTEIFLSLSEIAFEWCKVLAKLAHNVVKLHLISI